MARDYLKKATLTAQSGASDVHELVREILSDIEEGGDAKAQEYAAKFDKYDGNIILSEAEIAAACDQVPKKLKDDIQFAHDNVRRFAEAQKATVSDFEYEVVPGLTAGAKGDPGRCGGVLCARRALQSHCQRDHDSHNRQSRRVPAHHSNFAAPARRWRRASNCLRGPHLRSGQDHGNGRCAGRCGYDVRTVRLAQG